MVDELSARYGDLLVGSYDCVDHIVLNAYFSPRHSPVGFRVWGGSCTTAVSSTLTTPT
jgi:hypothetical protein